MGDWLIYILIGFVALCLVGIPLCIMSDRKAYNNGICPKCGTKLIHFDTDSQGSRGYYCVMCKYVTWVGWPVDRKRKER